MYYKIIEIVHLFKLIKLRYEGSLYSNERNGKHIQKYVK